MELEFRKDFDQVRERWSEFWAGRAGRPMLNFVIPKPGVAEVSHPQYLAGTDGNFTPIIDQMLRYCETHLFLGDMIPYFVLEWGPDTCGAYLGAGLRFATGTSWAVPVVEDWDRFEVKFRRDNHWWRMTEDLVGEMLARCEGKFLINPPSLAANLDALAALRGSENLLMDMAVCPDKVLRALDQVCAAHAEIMRALADLLDFGKWGTVNNSGMHSSGWTTRPQCDISCMISPEMFRKFALPCLRREMAIMQGVEYHLDGPDAAKHIDALCELENLDVISWQPTTGHGQTTPEILQWRERQYKKVDDLGMGIGRFGATREQVKQWWRQYKTRKLFCQVPGLGQAEIEDFLAELEAMPKPENM